MSNRQLRMTLGDEPADRAPGTPLIYIASPLTHLDQTGRDAVLAWGDIVESAIREATIEAEDDWAVCVHLPAKLSPPWVSDDRSSQEIFELNTDVLWCEADALIIIAHQGGSLGAGQELEWARAVQLPILYVHRRSEPVSRQVRGTPADITLCPFGDPGELRDAVTTFIRSRRYVIQDGPRRRRSRSLRFTPLALSLHDSWRDRDQGSRREIAALAGLDVRSVERLLTDPLRLATLASAQLAMLSSALDHRRRHGRVGDSHLTIGEMQALVAAQAEYGWEDPVAQRLIAAARKELTITAIRRFRLTTVESWLNLHERTIGD